MPVPENQEDDISMEEITSSLPGLMEMAIQIIQTHSLTMESSLPLANINPLQVLTIVLSFCVLTIFLNEGFEFLSFGRYLTLSEYCPPKPSIVFQDNSSKLVLLFKKNALMLSVSWF